MATNIYDGTATGQEGNFNHASNWSLGHVPAATEDIVIPASAGAITGIDYSATQIRSFTREAGHASQIGTSQAAPLILNIGGTGAFFDHDGTGDAFISLGASAIAPIIRNSGNGIGGYGLFLMGTAMTTLYVFNGSIKLIAVDVNDIEVRGGTVFCDRACVLTDTGNFTLSNLGGIVIVESAIDAIRSRSGTTTINGSGAVASLLADGGLIICNTTGTVTLAQADNEGVIDFIQSNALRTVTTMTRSGNGTIHYDPDIITLTNPPTSDGPAMLAKSSAA